MFVSLFLGESAFAKSMADVLHGGDDYTFCSGTNNPVPFSDTVQVHVHFLHFLSLR